MENSPEVRIIAATTDKSLAYEKFRQAKKMEAEWMADVDGDSGDWAEACIRVWDVPGVRSGDHIHILVRTEWYEEVSTDVYPFFSVVGAKDLVSLMKDDSKERYPGITPFNEEETFEETMHLEDPELAVDIYFSIEEVVVE